MSIYSEKNKTATMFFLKKPSLVLSVVSSMFDPLLLVSPVLIVGCLLFQEATRLKLDQDVPRNIQTEWLSWLKDLSDLDQVRIPRCIKPQDGSYTILAPPVRKLMGVVATLDASIRMVK